MASSGRSTIGIPRRLNEVLSTTGRPVSFSKASISARKGPGVSSSTVWTRQVPSTCTISPDENAGQVDRVLADHPELAADDLGAERPTIALRDDRRYLQLLPHRDGTDGFFVARLRRAG